MLEIKTIIRIIQYVFVLKFVLFVTIDIHAGSSNFLFELKTNCILINLSYSVEQMWTINLFLQQNYLNK